MPHSISKFEPAPDSFDGIEVFSVSVGRVNYVRLSLHQKIETIDK